MKIVVNRCFGGFRIAKYIEKNYFDKPYYEIERTNAKLIYLIETLGSDAVSGPDSKLRIVEIPDTATDWEISDFDGKESLTYVVDGKLHHA